MKLLRQKSLEKRKNKSVRNRFNDSQLQVDTNAWDPLVMKLQKMNNKNLRKAKKRKAWSTIVEGHFPEIRCGVRANWGTTDMVFVVQQLQEKCRKQKKGL